MVEIEEKNTTDIQRFDIENAKTFDKDDFINVKK